MKTEEMADLLDGLAGFLDKFGTKSALADLRTVSECFRGFSGESVSGFCAFVVKAKEGKPARRKAESLDRSKVEEHVARLRHFLDHRPEYDYASLDRLLAPVGGLKMAEIKAIGERIGCPLTARTKGAMLATLRNWLSDILLSDHQSSFSLNAAAS